MEIEVFKTKRKLTASILNQMHEATMKDMIYCCREGTVLGYINPVGSRKHRSFLIKNEKNDYVIVTNYDWELVMADPSKLRAYKFQGNQKIRFEKQFLNEATKIEFLKLFRTIKTVALRTHIFI